MSETPDNGKTNGNGRVPRWVWAALIVSLAVNLLVAGAVGGNFWAHRHGGYWGKHHYGHSRHEFFENLSSERREEVKKIFREHRKQVRPLWQNVREARRKAAEVLQQDTLDETQAIQVLNELYQAELNARQASGPMLIEVVQKLEPKERKAFLEAFLKRGKGKRRWRGHRDDSDNREPQEQKENQ